MLSALRFDRDRACELGRHALLMAVFNTAIGVGLWLVQGRALDVQLVHSFAIGTSIWLLCDLGRFVFKVNPHSNWPEGWRLWLLWALAIGLGYAIGMSIGRWYAGPSPYYASLREPRRLAGALLTGLALSGGVTFFFYSRGRALAHQRLLAEARRTATDTRLKLLEAQLQPHMLFNTLANLRVLIGLDPPRAQAMLDDLNSFLRTTLTASRAPLHPLADEFERLRSYLALMQVRMGERLHFTLELPPALATLPVPPSLLQPLAENALCHGLEPKVGPGHLHVSASRQGDRLQLVVHDDGLGLPQGMTEGVGLSLVRERLAAVYGTQATFTIHSAASPEGGTLATLDLPWPPQPSRP